MHLSKLLFWAIFLGALGFSQASLADYETALAEYRASLTDHPVAYPVDEAKNDLSFLKFRNSLTNLVIDKDVEGIIANTCPNIKLSFGDTGGHEALRERLTSPESAEYWGELLDVLLLGGRFVAPGGFSAPYTFNAEVSELYNPFDTYFIMGTNVLVRNKPAKTGTPIDSLSYSIVTVSLPEWKKIGYDNTYLPINQLDGTIGYVHKRYLRNQVSYRALFSKNDSGQWKMCMFIAGD